MCSNWRRLGRVLVIVCVLTVMGTNLACHDDSNAIEQHQKMLDEEGD